ncbi:MAG TPA: ATP-binding cassette domain-containing protein [Micromonosporaceae bacterium]
MSTTPLLELRRVNKRFGAVQVLNDVTFTARAGDVTVLVGDNGAGKSTLTKCIGGIHSMDSGSYLLDGTAVNIRTASEARRFGIDIAYQDLALCDNLDIVQNMFLGRELHRGMVLDEPEMEHIAAETLRRLSATTVRSIRQPVYTLSGGQRQTVAIAKAILWSSRIVVLDEPTAALGLAQTARILELIRQLADDGRAVVVVSHNMNDVFAVADSIATLYLGRMAAQVRASQLTYRQLIELITTGSSGDLGLTASITGREKKGAWPRPMASMTAAGR